MRVPPSPCLCFSSSPTRFSVLPARAPLAPRLGAPRDLGGSRESRPAPRGAAGAARKGRAWSLRVPVAFLVIAARPGRADRSLRAWSQGVVPSRPPAEAGATPRTPCGAATSATPCPAPDRGAAVPGDRPGAGRVAVVPRTMTIAFRRSSSSRKGGVWAASGNILKDRVSINKKERTSLHREKEYLNLFKLGREATESGEVSPCICLCKFQFRIFPGCPRDSPRRSDEWKKMSFRAWAAGAAGTGSQGVPRRAEWCRGPDGRHGACGVTNSGSLISL